MCTIFSAGSNAHGQLGHGNEDDSHLFAKCTFSGIDDLLPSGTEVISIVGGANHTLILIREPGISTQLWGAGDGRKGQLGEDYRQSFGTSSIFQRISLPFNADAGNITAVAAAWETSYVVFSDSNGDTLLSSGSDDFGDIGTGAQIRGQGFSRSWQTISFRNLLPESATSIRIGNLKAGPHNILAKLKYRTMSSTLENEIIVGWGAARQGQMGPLSNTLGKPQSFFSSPVKIDIPYTIQDFAIGNQHTIFLSMDGHVLGLGSNRKEQLSGLNEMKDVVYLDTTWNGTYLVQKGADNKCWMVMAGGSNTHSQLALDGDSTSSNQLHEVSFDKNTTKGAPEKLVCGSEHILLVLDNRPFPEDIGVCSSVYGWGWNEHGNLGLGHKQDISRPSLIWPNDILCGGDSSSEKLIGVWAGCATSWIAVNRL